MLPVLALVAAGLYTDTLDHPMIIDDRSIILQHPHVTSPEGIRELWADDYWADQAPYDNLYRPVTILSYYLNARIPGVARIDDTGQTVEMSIVGFRVFNVALLALLAWLIGVWLERGAGPFAAWSAALLLTVHPSCAFLIHHVVGRADLLAMIGVIGVLIVQRNAMERGRWSLGAIVSGLLLTTLAAGSKETGVVVLPAALAQWWVTRPANQADASDAPARPGEQRAGGSGLWPILFVVMIPLLAYGVARLIVLGGAIADQPDYSGDLSGNPLRGVPFLERLPSALSIAWWYARQTVWPDTGFFHTPNTFPEWSSLNVWLGLGVLLIGTAGLIGALRRRSFVAPALAAALGQYLLVGNLLVHIGSWSANRMMLPFLLAAAALLAAAIHRWIVARPRLRIACGVAVVAAAIAFGTVVVRDVNVRWSSWIMLAEADVIDEPDNLVNQYHYALALLMTAKDNPDSLNALRYADHAARIIAVIVRERPESRQARFQLAHLYLQLGRYDQAEAHYARLLLLEPGHAKGVRDVGILALRRGQTAKARDYLNQAATLLPEDDEMLAEALAELRKRSEPPPR